MSFMSIRLFEGLARDLTFTCPHDAGPSPPAPCCTPPAKPMLLNDLKRRIYVAAQYQRAMGGVRR